MYGKCLAVAAVLAGITTPGIAPAASYAVDCGTGGSTGTLQTQVTAAASSPGSTVTVTGTCSGDLNVLYADNLTISGLNLSGNLYIDHSRLVAFSSTTTVTGSIDLLRSRDVRFGTTVANASLQVSNGSQVQFASLTMAPWSGNDPSINCLSQSECTILTLSMSGTGHSTSIGITVGSLGRLVLPAGTVSGFGTGLYVWDNAAAFLVAGNCQAVNIKSNLVTGLHVLDGGLARLIGISAADAASQGCPAAVPMTISANGNYGVLAEGGGHAYLYQTAVSGHAIDNIRIQNGSVARIESSTIGAASTSGRSARVAHGGDLYFAELTAGSSAHSTLSGPVCVTGNSSVDTSNSATVITTTSTCTSP